MTKPLRVVIEMRIGRLHSSGQIMAPLVVLMVIATTIIFSVVAMQHQALKQWQLQMIADDAAESGATVFARNLNFIALTNRAISANQVALGQMLGLSTMFNTMLDFTDRAAKIARWIPYVTQIAEKLRLFLRKTKIVMDRLFAITATGIKTFILALSGLQVTSNAAFTTYAMLTIDDVIKRSGMKLSWQAWHGNFQSIVPAPMLWFQRLRPILTSREGEKSDLLHVTRASRDPFTRERSYNWFNFHLVKVPKAGGTELTVAPQGRWNWQSLDTLSFHLFEFWRWREKFQMGRNAKADNRIPAFQPKHHAYGDAYAVNPNSARYASARRQALGQPQLPFVYHNAKDLNDDFPSLILQIKYPEKDKAPESMQAIAKSSVYFSRPKSIFPRGDSLYESANLFNSLWQTKLEPLTVLERSLFRIRVKLANE